MSGAARYKAARRSKRRGGQGGSHSGLPCPSIKLVPAPVMNSPLVESVFAALSSARGSRIFHPEGSVHRAEAEIYDAFPGLLRGRFRAEFRLSRAFGLPTAV